MTGKNPAEVPNMAQRTVMQCLSLDDWKIVAHLPIPAGELMLSRMREYGWIESRSEKHKMAVRLTPAGLKAMRSPIV
jgi:predicted transcriptional regulator